MPSQCERRRSKMRRGCTEQALRCNGGTFKVLNSLYQRDLAYIQDAGFGESARKAAPEIIRRLRTAAIPIHRVVDVGCGAGPLAQELIAAGFAVTGIDPSAELLTFARRAAPAADFIHGSVYDVSMPA